MGAGGRPWESPPDVKEPLDPQTSGFRDLRLDNRWCGIASGRFALPSSGMRRPFKGPVGVAPTSPGPQPGDLLLTYGPVAPGDREFIAGGGGKVRGNPWDQAGA